jgi:hypothetical protein
MIRQRKDTNVATPSYFALQRCDGNNSSSYMVAFRSKREAARYARCIEVYKILHGSFPQTTAPPKQFLKIPLPPLEIQDSDLAELSVEAVTMRDILSGWKGTGLSLCVVHQVSRSQDGKGQMFHSIDVVFPGKQDEQRNHLLRCQSLPCVMNE